MRTRCQSLPFVILPRPATCGLIVTIVLAGACSAPAGVTSYSSQAAWQGAVSGVTQIDFEDLAAVTPVSNQYAGLTFSAVNGGSPRATAEVSANSGLNLLGINPNTSAYDGGGGVAIDFAVARSAVAFWFDDSEFAGNFVTLLDASNQQLAQFELSYPHEQEWVFTGFTSTSADIARVEISIGPADYVALDDLQYGSANHPVPEPASLGLFTLAAAGLAAFRRRRRRD